MVDQVAIVRLPPAEVAPAYRESLGLRSRFAVTDLGAGLVTVVPAHGAGALEQHFEVHELCTADSDHNARATWAPLRKYPPRVRQLPDPAAYRNQMLARAEEFLARGPEQPEAQFTAFALMAFGAAETGDLENLLRAQVPPLFEAFPNGRLMYVTVSEHLLARLAFARAQTTFHLAPDLLPGEEMDQLRAFSELTLTQGIDSTALMQFPLLAFSPAALGVVIVNRNRMLSHFQELKVEPVGVCEPA